MFSRETQAFMEAAVDAVIVIDHHGKMLAVNDSTAKMFGYRVDELLGESVNILMPRPPRDDHDKYVTRYLSTGAARIIGIGREVTALRRDGSPFPVQLSVGRVPDSGAPRFVGLLRDVSAEHEATAALKRERDRAQGYLELNDAILVALDPDRRICEVNNRGSQLLGAPGEEILGCDWLDFIDGETEREQARRLLSGALASGASREREFDAIIASGELRRIHWRCIALRAVNGTPSGWLCSGADVTERERRAEQAHLAQDRITRVALLATMGEMAAGVAHELNQPLTAITTYARACERYMEMPEPDMAELREAVREISAEGLRAGGIIGRLRHLVRSDEIDDRVLTDVNALIEELGTFLTADARLHDTRLRLKLAPELPPVHANPSQIQQVVLNLMRNAFEALLDVPVGGREVELATARTPTADVEIRVTDNGPGVSPAIAGSMFDPFATTKESGTGLGLAISRTIAHAHGGTIDSLPSQSRGASFRVQLPAVEKGRS